MMDAEQNASDLSFDQIDCGMEFCFEAEFSQAQVKQFAVLSGDLSPLHVERDYARKLGFEDSVVHGMLAASLFSRLIGMYCPGKRAFYLGQTLDFVKPIYANAPLSVTGKVVHKSDSTQTVTLKTTIRCGGEVVVRGEALARVLTI